jgi:hypothetical protein
MLLKIFVLLTAFALRLWPGRTRSATSDISPTRHPSDVPSQDFVDEGLISDAAATGLLAELTKHSWIDANGDQLARLVAEAGTADAPHSLQLLRGRIWDLGEINRAPRTPRARGGSPASR